MDATCVVKRPEIRAVEAAAAGSFSGPRPTTDCEHASGRIFAKMLRARAAPGLGTCLSPRGDRMLRRARFEPVLRLDPTISAAIQDARQCKRAAAQHRYNGKGLAEQRCVAFRPGGSAIFAMDLQSILLE